VNALEFGGPVTVRSIHTPEGVSIPFEVASVGDRLVAFLIDVVIIHSAVIGLMLLGLIAGLSAGGVGLSLAILASFLLRNFYFVVMELRWGGQSVGKKRTHLRVVSRDGGPLTSEAILARNLTRDMEVFLPLTALMVPAWLVSGGGGWARLASVAWLIVVALLPLFNREHLRCGDIVGGTLVVKMPEPVLLDDLARSRGAKDGAPVGAEEGGEPVFADEQLDLYGIKELQVLEDVLRFTERADNQELIDRVCEQIRRKIDWRGPQVEPRRFLLAFYKAQRGRLEHRMLFGERRESKRG